MTKSTDYHDYVFRDGRLVGEFEEMYRNSVGIPWHQDEQYHWIDVQLIYAMLSDLGKFNQIHDFGCGTGHFLDLIAKKFIATDGTAYGYDISPTACERARIAFPHNDFFIFDLMGKHQAPSTKHQAPNTKHLPRLFMIRGTLWYVFPKLEIVINNIQCQMLGSSDRLLIAQNFPPLDKSFIGKEKIPNHHVLIEYFSRVFSVEKYIWYEDALMDVNDNWFIGLFSLKYKEIK